MSARRRFAYAAASVLIAVAALVLIVIIFIAGSDDATAARLGFTAGELLVFGLSAAAGTMLFDAGRPAWLGILCVLLSLAAFITLAIYTWTIPDEGGDETGLIKAGGSLAVASLALGDASFALSRDRSNDGLLARSAAALAVVSVGVLAILLIVAIYGEITDSLYWRFVGSAAVLWLLATTMLPLARRIQVR